MQTVTLSATPNDVIKNINRVVYAKLRVGSHCKTGLETDSYHMESYNVIMNIREMTSTHFEINNKLYFIIILQNKLYSL